MSNVYRQPDATQLQQVFAELSEDDNDLDNPFNVNGDS